MTVTATLEALADMYPEDGEASVEGLTDLQSILKEREQFVASFDSEVETTKDEKPKKPPTFLKHSSDGRYDLILDMDMCMHICFDGPAKVSLMKAILNLPAGSRVFITTGLFGVDTRALFIVEGVLALLNVMRARGIELVFRVNNTCSYIDVAIMSLCHSFIIYDFAFLELGNPHLKSTLTQALQTVFATFRTNIFDYLIEKKFITDDELQALVDNPADNSIFLSATEMRSRTGM